MRIVIDLQGAQTGSRFRGIGRYTMSLVRELIRQRGDHEILIVLNGIFAESVSVIRDDLADILDQDKILVWDAFSTVHYINEADEQRRRFAEYVREAFIANLRPDVLLVTSLFEGAESNAIGTVRSLFDLPTSVVLYDLIPFVFPNSYLAHPGIKSWYLDKIYQLGRANCLLAISGSSAKEAVKYLAFDKSKIANISTASDGTFRRHKNTTQQSAYLKERFGINRPFLLYVSGADERKNQAGLIAAYASLPAMLRTKFQLVLSGAMERVHVDRFRDIADKARLSADDLVITGQVTDADLQLLYSGCNAFAFPSWHEGFGLPALEAMHCGKAVIASNTSSLPEVIGLEEALFDPFNTEEMAGCIERVMFDKVFRTKLEHHADKQCLKFSWENCAKAALDKMLECALDNYNEIGEISPAKTTDYVLDRLIDRLKSERLERIADPVEVSNCLAANLPPYGGRRQLLVDVSELVNQDSRSGIQRVVRSILKAWLENGVTGWRVEPVYGTMSETGYRYAHKFKSRFLGLPNEDVEDAFVDAYPGDVFLGLDLQHHVVERQTDALKQFRARGVSVGFVVYDLLPIKLGQYFVEGMSPVHQTWLQRVASYDRALCISKAVADELVEWLDEFGEPRTRPFAVDWFHLGADHTAANPTTGLPDNAEHTLALIGKRPTFLMVGTIEPRKGYVQVLNAFDQLWNDRQDVNLVFVGKRGWNVDSLVARMLEHPEKSRRLFWLEGISDEYLDKIYAGSSCLIAASEGEGFGLPLIEAAQHKIPLIVRDIPVFREVAGKHASYFEDTLDSTIISSAVKAWLAKAKSNSHPKSDRMPWLTWDESAQALIEIILKPNTKYKSWPTKRIKQRLKSYIGESARN